MLQQVAARVHRAYIQFLSRVTGLPSFRSCSKFFNICYPQSGYSIRGNYLHTKIYGKIKILMHRPLTGTIKQIAITNNEDGWFLLVTTDAIYQLDGSSSSDLAIDLGVTDLYTTHTGVKCKGPTHQKYYDSSIDKLKSMRDKLQRGSRKCKHLSHVIRQLYRAKLNKTRDSLHKASCSLSSKYDTVYVEKLEVKRLGESKITGRNRNTRNSCVATFISMLRYKVKNLIEVNPAYTSKACAYCGTVQDIPLRKRTYKCPHCGLVLDRDHNAAINILHLGRAVARGLCNARTLVLLVDRNEVTDRSILSCLEQAMVVRPCTC